MLTSPFSDCCHCIAADAITDVTTDAMLDAMIAAIVDHASKKAARALGIAGTQRLWMLSETWMTP